MLSESINILQNYYSMEQNRRKQRASIVMYTRVADSDISICPNSRLPYARRRVKDSMCIQLFKLLNSLARQGVLSPLHNGKTQTYPRGSDRGKVHGRCCLTPRSAPLWFPRVQRKWSFRAAGKHVQGRKRGEYKRPVQGDETIQLLLSRLMERIKGRRGMLCSIDEIAVCA